MSEDVFVAIPTLLHFTIPGQALTAILSLAGPILDCLAAEEIVIESKVCSLSILLLLELLDVGEVMGIFDSGVDDLPDSLFIIRVFGFGSG